MQQLMVPKVRRIFPVATAFVAGALLVAILCWLKGEGWSTKPETMLLGTNLRLLGQIGPFGFYSKLDGTNEYVIFKGKKCLVSHLRAGTNDIWETTHFENGQSVLIAKTEKSGVVIDRMFSARDRSGQDMFSYIDADGDGQWDVMLDFAERKKYIRQQRIWVPASSVKKDVAASDGDKLKKR